MNLSLQQCQRQEIRQKQIMICGVCKREAKHIDWNLLDADQPASHMEAVIWYRDNQPTGLEWFLWKVANGRCPNCTQVLCDGQVPDRYIKRWLKIYKSTKEVSDAQHR